MSVMLFSLFRMWILIHLIDDGEKVPDVIPNAWKIDQSSCWYPKNLKSNVINSLARKQIMPDHSSDDWEYCTMQIIETNISVYIPFNIIYQYRYLIIIMISNYSKIN